MAFWLWSKTAASNATADSLINWAEGQPPSSVNDSARAMMAEIAKFRDDIAGLNATTGTGTAYALTSNQVFTSLVSGQVVAFYPGTTNTGNVTLAVDGLTAKPLRSPTAVEIPAGTLVAGTPYTAAYNGTEWIVHGIPGFVSIPLGSSLEHWVATAPSSNFALMYGQAISRTTYAGLFALISTNFGVGDGANTFNIPDCRGRAVFGKDDMGGSAASRLTNTGFGNSATTVGNVGGTETITLDSSTIPSHTHTISITDPGHSHTYTDTSQHTLQANNAAGTSFFTTPTATGTSSSAATGVTATASSTGSSGAHKNVPPGIVASKIMRIL